MDSRPTRLRSYGDFLHPRDIAELQRIVRNARAAGSQVRVRGALHSERGSVLSDGLGRGGRTRPAVNVMLDRINHVRIQGRSVVAGAGVSLGGDPHAPHTHLRDNEQRYAETSLFARLHEAGLALPITGGISHQTLGGFLATGSAGGSLRHSFQDAVVRVDFVDGTGELRSLRRGDAHFPGALVSLGLWGVVTEIELECEDDFEILGFASTQPVEECDFDLFGESGRPGLDRFLRDKEYARAMWWPQPGVDRVELWEAVRYDPERHDGTVGSGLFPAAAPPISPVQQILARLLFAVVLETAEPRAGEGASWAPTSLGQLWELVTSPVRGGRHFKGFLESLVASDSPTRLEGSDVRALLVDLGKQLCGHEPPKRLHPATPQVPEPAAGGLRARTLDERVIARLINQFIPLTPLLQQPWQDFQGFARQRAGHVFRDAWHTGLPMDNPVHDRLLPISFTEVWLPMAQAHEAMRRLRALFRRERLAATGTFCIEIYAAKSSPAWISAAHEADVFRLDPFWFDDGDTQARARFFAQFWDTLADLDVRLHWAKALSSPWSTTGVAKRRAALPELAKFLQVRALYDPDDVFLTRYWAEHLGIAPAAAPPSNVPPI